MKPRCILWILFLNVFHTTFADEPTVLLINSFHQQYQWTEELTSGMRDVLKSRINIENFRIENMDTRWFVDDELYEKKILHLFQYKYGKIHPDIVITSDHAAYSFMLKYGDELFPHIPIVFCGVNIFDPKALIGKPNITGIQEGMEILGNLNLIMQVQPQTRKIIMLADTTELGTKMVRRAKNISKKWLENRNEKINLDILNSFSIEKLYQETKTLDENTVILILAVQRDQNDVYFSYSDELTKLARNSAVPIYSMWGVTLGKGAVGGVMNNAYDHGHNTAELALQILDGEPISNLKIKEKCDFSPSFDYEYLTKYNISQNRLPKNSIVINKPVPFYSQHPEIFEYIVVLVLCLLFVIFTLILNISGKIRVQKRLNKFNKDLEILVNKRTRALNDRNQELELLSQKMEKLAYTDSLTNLSNRRAATDKLEVDILRHNKENQLLSIAIVDLDFFKKINDTYGHQIGDEVLVLTSKTIRESLRKTDHVYRWGGEEFLIILPNTSLEDAILVCKNIRQKIEEMVFPGVRTITTSIGLYTDKPGLDYNLFLQKADEALYKAKDQGRNQLVVAT